MRAFHDQERGESGSPLRGGHIDVVGALSRHRAGSKAMIGATSLTRPRHDRRRPQRARPGPVPSRQIPGSGRTAAAGGVHTRPGGFGLGFASLASRPQHTSLVRSDPRPFPVRAKISKVKGENPQSSRSPTARRSRRAPWSLCPGPTGPEAIPRHPSSAAPRRDRSGRLND